MYGYDAMKVLLPLFIPMLAALVGLQAGVLVFTRYRGVALWRNRLLWAAVLVAGIAAMLPNSGQRMFDLGFSLPLIDLIENGSYFLFFFALMGAWTLFEHGWKRWALLVLVPIALFEPLKWTYVFFLWSVWGFAP